MNDQRDYNHSSASPTSNSLQNLGSNPLEGNHAKSGITGLLLAIGAMVSETSLKIVKQALESTKTKHVLEWCREKLGKTVQAKKREVFRNHDKAEQKLDQLKKPA